MPALVPFITLRVISVQGKICIIRHLAELRIKLLIILLSCFYGTLKNIVSSNKSLILAQDERWRRA
jgi:hypothetical protein